MLSPLALDPARPFPKVLNKSLNFAIVVEGEDGFGRNSGLAVVQAPRSLPRLIRLPDELGSRQFVFLGTIVEAFVSKLFAGMRVRGCYQFRVTRNSDLFVEQEEVDDLLRAVEGELASRRYGDAVRLETAHDCPEEILSYLLEQFALTERRPVQGAGPVNLNRLMALYDLVDVAELKYPAFTPEHPGAAAHRRRLIRDAAQRAMCCCITRFRASARSPISSSRPPSDPQVLAIKQTLYRAGSDSAIVGALVEAAQAGQGRDGDHRAARAIRRGGEHRAREQAAGGRRTRDVRRLRLQDAREAGDGRAPRGEGACAAIATWEPAIITPRPRASTRITD